MTTLVAPIVGPLLGGWITDNAHWSWIFFINIPVGTDRRLRHLAAATRTAKRRAAAAAGPRRAGLLVVSGSAALQIMLDKGNELDWFNSEFIVVLAVIVVVGFSLFLVWELTEAHPIVDLRCSRSAISAWARSR